MKAKMICARCDCFLHWTETYNGDPTHGICDPCLKANFPALYFVLTHRPHAWLHPPPNQHQPANLAHGSATR